MTLSRRRAASCPGRMAGVDGEPVGTDREFHDAAICLDMPVLAEERHTSSDDAL
jgi:hypothetical protein